MFDDVPGPPSPDGRARSLERRACRGRLSIVVAVLLVVATVGGFFSSRQHHAGTQEPAIIILQDEVAVSGRALELKSRISVVFSGAFDPGSRSRHFIMASRDGTMGVCDAHAGQRLPEVKEARGPVFADNGKCVIRVCVGGSACTAWIGDAKAEARPLIAIQQFTTPLPSPLRAIRRTIGLSREGLPIEVFDLGSGRDATLVLAGVNGDEPTGTFVVDQLVGYLETHRELVKDRKVIFVPRVNPDGLKKGTRVNANGVDINRNFPTRDWAPSSIAPRFNPGPSPGSEPETKALLSILNSTKPCKIISVHAPYRENNVDGPAKALAEEMARHNHYPVTLTLSLIHISEPTRPIYI